MTEFKPGDYYQLLNPNAGVGPDVAHIVWQPTPPVFGKIVKALGVGYVVCAFSAWCPEGELGTLYPKIEPCRLISKETFEAARARGWL